MLKKPSTGRFATSWAATETKKLFERAELFVVP
jgi:hypothetical protein